MKNAKFLFAIVSSFTMALIGCGNEVPSGGDVKVAGVTISESSLDMKVGEEFTLTATVAPNDATNKEVTWSSSHSEFASVSNGVVTALAVGETDITVTTLDGSYTDTCHVSVFKEETRTIKGYIFDSKSLIDGNPYYKNDQEYIEITDKGEDGGVPYYLLPYEKEIRFSLKDKDTIKATGMKVDDVAHEIDKDGYVSFVAHVDDESEFFLSLEVTFKDETPIGGDYSFSINNSDHISLEMYAEDKVQRINGTNQGDVVYIKPVASNENFEVHKIVVTYYTSDVGSKMTLEATKEGDYYKFTTPYCYNKVLTITVSEINNSLLKGYELPGNYLVVEKATYTSNHVYDEFSANTLQIASSGAIKFGNYSNQLASATSVTGRGTAHDAEHYTDFIYDTNFFFANAGGSDALRAPFAASYDLVAVKMKDNTEKKGYSLNTELIVLDKTYFVITVYYLDDLYACALVNYTDKVVYFNTTLEMLMGNKITDARAIYSIFQDKDVLVSVSYQNDGGNKERIALDSGCGVFTGDYGNLIVPNTATGIYEDSNYVLVIDGTTYKLSNADYIVTLTVDVVNMTYIFVSKEANTSSIPSFKGLTFKGNVYSDWDEGYVNVWVVFDDYDGDNIAGKIIHGAGTYSSQWFAFTATYDLGNNVITLTITSQQYGKDEIGRSCNATCAEGKMTFTSEFSSRSPFTVKGLVATCSDFHL